MPRDEPSPPPTSRREPIKPDYGAAWIGGVIPGLCSSSPPDWLPDAAVAANRVVVLVLDGLGWSMLADHGTHLPTISGMTGRAVTCGVPSTTATGLSCITTGLTPAEHGLLGYRFGLDQGVLNVLRWRYDGGRKGPDAATLQPVPAFDGRPLPTIVKSEFDGTGFTEAHLRGGHFRGWQTPAVLRNQVALALQAGSRVVYAYYDGIDKVAHAHGLGDPMFTAELADTNRLVDDLLALIPSDGALVITADHGHVEVGPDAIVGTDPVDRLIARRAGESRFRSLYARPNKQQELLTACREVFGDRCWVFSRDELFDGGWFGPAGPPQHRRRIGDVVLAPFADIGIADPATPGEDQMASRHGSLTEEEMLVPLLAAAGQAA
ncbi:alkaline phosphatase family protein [Euzebya tangerina]|uniref:alkaline phosphatase family protein n=1 Tax=Euzebya tangerina TaxID=591198 RepID=UPI000E31CFC7|nr:alkaline phosphatase family protein [Euzebya tangerina]